MQRIKLVFLVSILILILGCNQTSCYYVFPQSYLTKYKVYVGVKGQNPLPRNTDGDYFIRLEKEEIYTSTKYEEIADTKSFFLINGKTGYISAEEMEEEFNIKIIENIAGITNSDNLMIPDYFEIVLEKK